MTTVTYFELVMLALCALSAGVVLGCWGTLWLIRHVDVNHHIKHRLDVHSHLHIRHTREPEPPLPGDEWKLT